MKHGCLLIHGFGGSPDDMEPLWKTLARQTEWTIATVQLTNDWRDSSKKTVTYKSWIEECLRAYDKLQAHCQSIDVIGFSLGGLLAVHVASRRKVRRVVLLAPAVQAGSPKQFIPSMKRLYSRIKADRSPINLTFQRSKSHLFRLHPRSYYELKKIQKNTSNLLGQIDRPTLLVLGEYDEFISIDQALVFYKEIQLVNKQFVLLATSGHFVCLDNNKEVVLCLVIQFLQKESNDKH